MGTGLQSGLISHVLHRFGAGAWAISHYLQYVHKVQSAISCHFFLRPVTQGVMQCILGIRRDDAGVCALHGMW